MKNIKLSLCVLAVLSCFQKLNATPLDEVVKDVEVSGILRYSYDLVTQTGEFQNWGGAVQRNYNQSYYIRSDIGFSGAIADNFKIFTHFNYESADSGYGANAVTDTSSTFRLTELYLIYTNEETATKIALGRQMVNSIWSFSSVFNEGYGKDVYGGLIGEGVKITNTSIDGLTLNLFGYDSFAYNLAGLVKLPNGFYNDTDSDIQADVGSWIARKNFYGASALGNYELGYGGLDTQLWLGYLPNRAIMYAASATYNTKIFDDMDYGLSVAYLGNSVDDIPKRQNFENGNFFSLGGTLAFNSWDFGAGILHYGRKDKKSFTVIEDLGSANNVPGIDIIYTNGSRLSGDLGENTFGYLSVGYTFFQKLRVGGGVVYGGTKVGEHEPFIAYNADSTPTTLVGQAGKKSEVYGTISYEYSPKLEFYTYYSHIDINRKFVDGTKDIARFQVLYKF